MTGHAPFLKAIIENPADDFLRLEYADWLEEHGEDERAEFIRVQIELAKPVECDVAGMFAGATCNQRNADVKTFRMMTWCHSCVHRAGLAQREKSLGELFWHRHPFPDIEAYGYTWHRGFVSALHISCEHWIRYGHLLRTAQPLERVQLHYFVFGSMLHPDGMRIYPANVARQSWRSQAHPFVVEKDGLWAEFDGIEVGDKMTNVKITPSMYVDDYDRDYFASRTPLPPEGRLTPRHLIGS